MKVSRMAMFLFCSLLIFSASCKDQQDPIIQKKEPGGALTVWINDELGYLKDYLRASLEQRFPDTDFSFTAFTSSFVLKTGRSAPIDDWIDGKGEMPDLIISNDSTLSFLSDRGLLDNLEPSLNGAEIQLGLLNPSLIDAVRLYDDNKRLIGVPLNRELYALFYNKTLFSRMELPFPKDGMTWDELLELSRSITIKSGITFYPLDSGISGEIMLQELGLGYIDPETKRAVVKSEGWTPILQFTSRLNTVFKPYDVILFNYTYSLMPSVDHLFGQKDAAMAVAALENNGVKDSAYDTYHRLLTDYGADDHFVHEYWDLEWDIATIPTFDGKTGPRAVFSFVGIHPDSSNKQEAMKAVTFLVSNDFQHELAKHGWAPALKDNDWETAFASAYPKLRDKNWHAFFQYEPAPYRKWNLYETKNVRQWGTGYTMADRIWRKSEMETLEKLESKLNEYASRVRSMK